MGSELFFLDCLWVNRGCGGWRIHSALVKAVSGAISERATTRFFVTVYESKGAVWANESIRHLWKEFRGLFLTGHRVSFLWLFMSEQGLWGLTNPFVTCEKSFEGYLWVGSNSVFLNCLWVTRGCLGWWIHWSPVKSIFWSCQVFGLMSSPKCRSVKVISNPARPGSNHREVNCINYK